MMGGEVELHGHHGNKTVFQGPFIRIITGVEIDELPGKPEIIPPGGVLTFIELLFPLGIGLSADPDPFQLRKGEFRDVHIQECTLGKTDFHHVADDFLHYFTGGGEIGIHTVVEQTESDTWDPLNGPFHGGRHGTRIDYVDGRVAAVVDTGNAKVGFAMEDLVDRQLDAVHGCSRTLPGLHPAEYGDLVEPEWPIDSDGMSHGRLGTIWSHHDHAAELFHGFNQLTYTRRRYTVVIGDQYHRFFLSG